MAGDHTPVLVGAAAVNRRVEDPLMALEPLALMIEASRQAGDDCGSPELLHHVQQVLVPVGRWAYRNPGRPIAEAIGAVGATSMSALPGISQQTLISDAANAIQAGRITAALVVGGEAGYRLQQATLQGVEVADTEISDMADVVLKPATDMQPGYERRTGLGSMPVGYYAIVDSCRRHAAGVGLEDHRDRTARRYHRFSSIAVTNPLGWDDSVVSFEQIRNGPMLAFPYTRHHVSNWSVDQASALLLTSVGAARLYGVPEDRWVYPQVFVESNHMASITARRHLHRCIGAEIAGAVVQAALGGRIEDLSFVELYSCFPVATDIYAAALGIADDRDWTFTGGMPFAGGPFNNFVLHATAQLVPHLRSTPDAHGLVTTVSGVLTKQGMAVWGSAPHREGFTFVDVTSETAAATESCPVEPDYVGDANVVGYTVVSTRQRGLRGVAIAENENGVRTIAYSDEPAIVGAMSNEEFIGRSIAIVGGRFAVKGDS